MKKYERLILKRRANEKELQDLDDCLRFSINTENSKFTCNFSNFADDDTKNAIFFNKGYLYEKDILLLILFLKDMIDNYSEE